MIKSSAYKEYIFFSSWKDVKTKTLDVYVVEENADQP